MIDLSRGLRHLAWADDQFFAAIAAMPSQALEARVAPGEWTVGRLAMHIVDGAQWCRYCLTGQPLTKLRVPEGSGDVEALRAAIAAINADLLEQVGEPDVSVVFEDEHGPGSALRSTILTQACMHPVEHRAQIACALAVAGLPSVSLDDLDLWAFESYEAGR